MTRFAAEQLVFMMDNAFEGDPAQPGRSWHALLVNVSSVEADDWTWLPPGGRRSIFTLLQNLGECKYMCDNHAFGDGSMSWSKPGSFPTVKTGTPPADVLEWLREGHRRLRGHVAALEDDSELLRPRPSYWGQEFTIQWQVNTMIQHDLYHAGEINHLRALRQGND